MSVEGFSLSGGETAGNRFSEVSKQDLTRLPEKKGELFEQKAHAEIAEELELPLGTVKSRIRLAFKRLRKELGEN